MENLKQAIEKVEQEINWDNWQKEDEDGNMKDNEYWELSEVLYCKLDWIKEEYNLSEESVDTINQVQELLQAITKDITLDK